VTRVLPVLLLFGCGSGGSGTGGGAGGSAGSESSGGAGSGGAAGAGGAPRSTGGTGGEAGATMPMIDAGSATAGEGGAGTGAGVGGSDAAGSVTSGGDASSAGGSGGTGGVSGPVKRYIYAASGTKISVLDMDNGHKLVKTINLPHASGSVDGICGNVLLHALFVNFNTATGRVVAMDLLDDKELWSKDVSPSADRGDVSVDGTKLFVPGGETSNVPVELVLDPKTGNEITRLTLTPKVHDTNVGASGKYAYLETKSSPIVSVVDIASDKIIRQLMFSDVAGPHAVNGTDTYVVANVFQFFGFEMADVATGKVVARVHAEGVPDPGNPAPAALRNHGIAWKPDETEVWEGSKYDPNLFIFDMTVMPPVQKRRITIGGGYHTTHWITFSIDGHYVYPSPDQGSGTPVQIYDSGSYQPIGTMPYSEELMEVDFSSDGRVVAVGSQYGIGRKTVAQ
jgi:WD40 repeat protein